MLHIHGTVSYFVKCSGGGGRTCHPARVGSLHPVCLRQLFVLVLAWHSKFWFLRDVDGRDFCSVLKKILTPEAVSCVNCSGSFILVCLFVCLFVCLRGRGSSLVMSIQFLNLPQSDQELLQSLWMLLRSCESQFFLVRKGN